MGKMNTTDGSTLRSIGLFAAALALGAAGAAAALNWAQRESSAERVMKECTEAAQKLESRLDQRQAA